MANAATQLTPALVKEHGLSPEEFERIKELLGREPNLVELGIFSALAPNPALTKLLAERDPVLVVFDGTAEQIHAASRTRLSGLIMDVMLLESLGGQAER